MAKHIQHTRILAFPYAEALLNARLDSLREETHGPRLDLIMDYRELRLATLPQLVSRDGQPYEQVQGHYVPRRLRFINVRELKRLGPYAHLENTPPDHGVRHLCGVLNWRLPGKDAFYVFDDHSSEPAALMFFARHYASEDRTGPLEAADFVRDWSPPPPLPARLVPRPEQLHRRYGGDPIPIRLGKRLYQRRLFVGGIDTQPDQRPDVAAVLNLGENASRWAATAQTNPADRWVCKGEGQNGMDAAEIAAEAHWAIERLRAGQRVLVHCSAGFNRSVTICCAVLILLEGLSAEVALERVREHHPWARPDTHHWLALRGLAQAKK